MGENRERRRYPRHSVKWPVVILTDDGTIEAETKNITVDGISIRCEEPLRMEEVFRMGIIPPDHPMIEFQGRVIWSDLYGIGADAKAYAMGVCFVEISEADRHSLADLFDEK